MLRIFVGNLPFGVTEDDLSQLFQAYGNVQSIELVVDRDTGKSRGFGFVEMPDEDAQRAIEGLNGRDMSGRSISVSEARPRTERGGSGPSRRFEQPGGGRRPDRRRDRRR